MVTPPVFVFSRPTGTWFALGVLYDLALWSVAFVVATVGGIAARNLYFSAKSGQVMDPLKRNCPHNFFKYF